MEVECLWQASPPRHGPDRSGAVSETLLVCRIYFTIQFCFFVLQLVGIVWQVGSLPALLNAVGAPSDMAATANPCVSLRIALGATAWSRIPNHMNTCRTFADCSRSSGVTPTESHPVMRTLSWTAESACCQWTKPATTSRNTEKCRDTF